LNTIGNVINQARKDKGLTVAELASKARVIEATLKNLIGNRITYPRRENLEPLCEVLELDIEEVMKNAPKEEENISVKQHEHHIYDILESHAKLEAHYEKRLADKREVIAELEKHNETIMKDKRWFRIGFIVVLSLWVVSVACFILLEAMHPQHGWIRW
jgi:transcriptional regulator with XRE-family HTH domain